MREQGPEEMPRWLVEHGFLREVSPGVLALTESGQNMGMSAKRVVIRTGELNGVGATIVGRSGSSALLLQPDDERNTLPGPRWYDECEVESALESDARTA